MCKVLKSISLYFISLWKIIDFCQNFYVSVNLCFRKLCLFRMDIYCKIKVENKKKIVNGVVYIVLLNTIGFCPLIVLLLYFVVLKDNVHITK